MVINNLIDSLETPRGLLREPPMITYSNLVMHGIMLQVGNYVNNTRYEENEKLQLGVLIQQSSTI